MTYGRTNIDDLWSHGGSGGSSAWGGKDGANGDEGASQARYDTDASKKYAKSGGSGGSCAEPKTVAFYTYKDSTSDPEVTCTSGHGATRNATVLGSLQEFTSKGGSLVSGGGASTYDGKPHGVSIGGSLSLAAQSGGAAVGAQSDGGEEYNWAEQGETTVDGVKVSYKVAYFDVEGNGLGAAPEMPGQYAALVRFTSDNPDYCGDWVEPIAISKLQVEKPTPAALTFECENWATGEGAEQEAFPNLDETDYEFVEASKTVGETSVASARKAKAAGEYEACFRLKDAATCEWADGTEGADAWVPWSIALQEFDPNEVTYWGTAYDNETTSLAYTGEPAWVRPWFTETRETDGMFPEWFTHWEGGDRPANSKSSAAVVYVRGDGSDENEEGLVGYHAGDGGALEPVTAAQIYVWANGVDVGGNHVDVNSGDKVWYEVGEDGWWVPLAVQGDEPEGADGHVVARDWGYVDRLGVMEAGEYQAYALFDEGAGFAQTALAEAAVRVGDDLSGAEVTLAQASYAYDGEAKEPAVESVVLGGKELVAGTDYEVSYEGNVNAGTAAALVTGKGAYYGTARAAFAIKGADISKAKVALAKTGYTYDGKAKKPAVKTVALGGKALKAGADYAVSYKGNVNAGTATVTVTGKGNYAGTAKATFKIAKAAQSIKASAKCSASAAAKKSGKSRALAKNAKVKLAKKAKVSAKTKVAYEKANKAGGKGIAVNPKTGVVTLKKGLKAGTYKVKVKLTAPAGKNYKAASPKTIVLTVKVK